MFKFKKGFTILEILVVLSILALLVAIVLPSFKAIRSNQVLKSAISDVLSALDKARSQSFSSLNSSEYGVHFEQNQIVIFKGTNYSPSDISNENVPLTLPAYISLISLTTGAVDLYFDRLSGIPNKTGTITISADTSSKIITISATGAISTN